jgi:[protein-PII] uridylyltransferase
MVDVQQLRLAYRHDQQQLLNPLMRVEAGRRDVRPALKQLARLADHLLQTLWKTAGLSHLALVAVGGYGRGELFPASDLDVLVLLPQGADLEQLGPGISSFIGVCWDAGLEIGSSVRTMKECIEESQRDITIQTALLEHRQLAGDAQLYAAFATVFAQHLNPQAFFTAKMLELQQRHSKYSDTPYALEPNCKESPGGLRDLQAVLWVAKAAGLGNSWEEMATQGLTTDFEVRQIRRNEAILMRIRLRLHLMAKRREDRLLFDLQTELAESFAYTSVKANDGKAWLRPSEVLMRHYYWAAKAVTQLRQILLLNIEARLHPTTAVRVAINERFSELNGFVDINHDDLYLQDPQAILETFLIYQTTEGAKGLSARTLRGLYNARHLMSAAFRKDPVNRNMFMRILTRRQGVMHALRLMNETSVLGRYLCVFGRIVGQMQHDLFHVYTVDQHILMVLRNMRRFFMAEHAHEYPLCSQLAAAFDKPWVLYIACLFHDIAKGRGGDHSDLGQADVQKFCKDHGIAKEEAQLLKFLVKEHLSMSQVAQKSDLSDTEVIEQFATRVGNVRYLTALYLLTVADIRGTSPKVWNNWKGKLLENLFRATLRVLGGQRMVSSSEVETHKHDALVSLALHALPHEAHKPLWDTLDVSYFMRHDADDIAWHTRQLSRLVGSPQAVVRSRKSPLGEGLQVLVYTPDRPDLFARICGYFDQRGFSIQEARIHTARNGYALDTFQVVTAFLPEHYQELTNMVEFELTDCLNRAEPLPPAIKSRMSRRVKSFPIMPRISLKPDEQAQRWLLNITANDQSGLLYKIARVLARHNIDVQLAKVNTLGERVDDTFLISGEVLQNHRSQIDIETELLEACGEYKREEVVINTPTEFNKALKY